MSSVEEKTELKGGHPPAVKAGGMRVSRPRHSSTGESKTEPAPAPTPAEEEEYGASPAKPERNASQNVSGVQTKGDKDYTPDAVKQFHEKPLPAKDRRPVQVPHNIQQPK